MRGMTINIYDCDFTSFVFLTNKKIDLSCVVVGVSTFEVDHREHQHFFRIYLSAMRLCLGGLTSLFRIAFLR